MRTCTLPLAILMVIGCTKKIKSEDMVESSSTSAKTFTTTRTVITNQKVTRQTALTFTKYTIQKGAHSCDQSSLKSVSGTSMNFIAKFDSTAIYPPVITDYNHAYDINKLYGFSEGFNNQYNSARIGWRWLNNQLQLFAYVYVKGTLLRDPVSFDPPFIKSVSIGSEISCSIAVSGSNYIFTVDGIVVKTPRGTTAKQFSGYQQYPYFGGTLTAPHLMNFYIK